LIIRRESATRFFTKLFLMSDCAFLFVLVAILAFLPALASLAGRGVMLIWSSFALSALALGVVVWMPKIGTVFWFFSCCCAVTARARAMDDKQ
jgi:hypothetical protein